jgi:DNA invertase Pin-like site-specific DNA recombinase
MNAPDVQAARQQSTTASPSTPAPVAFGLRSMSKIHSVHLDRMAMVYVRQSSPQQVLENRESRERQYALAQFAQRLGWPADRVVVIDDDQGLTGKTADQRSGFQRLMTEVSLNHVGMVLGLELSRLSRSNKDWHQLIDVCGIFNALLCDQDGVYDPLDTNDRLLLGMKGAMSEFELVTLRNRLTRGSRNKAERGELFLSVPIGYYKTPTGEVLQEPDEQARGLDQKGPGTDLGVECKRFTWSPDGSEIACAEFPEGRDEKVPGITHLVVDVRTKGKKPLKVPEGQVLNDWSLDGKVLLTTRFGVDKDKPRARLARLYLVNRDGSENKALTDEKQFSVAGRLSPDGKRVLHAVRTWPVEGKGGSRVEMTVLDISTGKSVLVGDVPKNGEIAGARWSPDGKRIAYVWRQLHGGKTEDVADKETEWRLVVCDPDGRNAKTILTETGPNPFARPLGLVDWR